MTMHCMYVLYAADSTATFPVTLNLTFTATDGTGATVVSGEYHRSTMAAGCLLRPPALWADGA